MQTHTLPPWHSDLDKTTDSFVKASEEVVISAIQGRLVLSQFQDHGDILRVLSGLMWRHYIIFCTARLASHNNRSSMKTLVECGVCEGLGTLFAMKSMDNLFRAYLYDAWAPMLTGATAAEAKMNGEYDYLALETTKVNLKEYSQNCEFIKGVIPDSFHTRPLPEDICWMHIDLNAGAPTKAALDALFPRMSPKSVVLLDDYAWPAHRETKRLADDFFMDKPGMLLQFPTGQAAFFLD